MANLDEILEEARWKKSSLLDKLAAIPVKDVYGVVSPTDVGAGKDRNENLWTLRFSLEFWRRESGELQRCPLDVLRLVTDAEWSDLKERIDPYNVIHIKARVISDAEYGNPQALLEEFLGNWTTDPELNGCKEELLKPVIYEDSLFGKFILDRKVNWFRGKVVWDGITISLDVSVENINEVEDSFKNARLLWKAQKEWNNRILDFAVQELLPLKNDNWLGTDELPLSVEQFLDRMTLSSITINSDGSFEFWFDDGDLFAGHWIEVYGNLSEGPLSADIPG